MALSTPAAHTEVLIWLVRKAPRGGEQQRRRLMFLYDSNDTLSRCVNIPWPDGGMGDADYVAAFQKIVMPIAYEFRPDFVLGGFLCITSASSMVVLTPEYSVCWIRCRRRRSAWRMPRLACRICTYDAYAFSFGWRTACNRTRGTRT